MNVILFDDPSIRQDLSPFTLTRPVSEIRVGILTLTEKWEKHLNTKSSFQTIDYLQEKYPVKNSSDNVLINGAVCPDEKLINAISDLAEGQGLAKDGILIAARSANASIENIQQKEYGGEIVIIDQVWKIFHHNGFQIKADFELITKGKKSKDLKDPHTIVYGEVGKDIFIEEGAIIKAAILNAENGPIYLGKNTQVQEGSMIRGPFALCEGSHVNMGAKIRGDTTVGPHSKVGGEISNSVIFGFSNKGHDGFLGNSVIGEWCNLGADTNTSNLKNNYENIKIWNYKKGGFKDTGLQFCGLIMGDHSKCGINTMFNTGTVVGIGCNIFGDGFPRTFIPSFAWGGAAGFTTFQLNKMLDTAEKVYGRRNRTLEAVDKKILQHLFASTSTNRVWEKKTDKA
ncbi:MAG TPA: GlmU family protein [Cyclobacteriaceae bacterium]|nr:GlmU family protein [Cyclobacteriaceae bacterium]HRK52984.1 GlmU family protein [Cyclobacteriaceae bacterium]